ncbi:MAG TPA: SIS domain-containing protein [Gemmatimonadetes bacterium]|nr:SIS domain-containing protein [Gemmatimonadota bacterium]
MRTHSLSSESSVVTAFANDFGYDKVFSGQLRMLGSTGDLLILISSSGNSQNVLEAAQEAKELRIRTIGFTGFSGGELKSMVDVNLHVPADNYGIVEDSHQALMHVFAQHLDQVRRGP